MDQNLVSFQIDAATVNGDVSVRRQLQNVAGKVAVTGVAESFGEALAVLRANLAPAAVDDVVYFFRKGFTGEQA